MPAASLPAGRRLAGGGRRRRSSIWRVARFGGLDCIFNNAGLGGAFGPIGETTVEEWDFTFHVLVRGVFLGIKHASEPDACPDQPGRLERQHHQHRLDRRLAGGAGPHAYSAAKAAVANLTRAVAAEIVGYRIRVNAIAPGLIATPLPPRARTPPAARWS